MIYKYFSLLNYHASLSSSPSPASPPLSSPLSPLFSSWMNLERIFHFHRSCHSTLYPPIPPPRRFSLSRMLGESKVSRIGLPHCGMDDVFTTVKLTKKMIERGAMFWQTTKDGKKVRTNVTPFTLYMC